MAKTNPTNPTVLSPVNSPASEYDVSSPFFLHHSDKPGSILVSQPLQGDNYPTWSRAVRMALEAKHELGFIDGSISQPEESFATRLQWICCNSLWDELSSYISHQSCTCGGLKSFLELQQTDHLLGLNNSYSSIRSQILLMEPLPSINRAYSLRLQEERNQSIHDVPTSIVEHSAMAANRKQQPKFFPSNTKSSGKKPNYYCDFCDTKGHSESRWFKKHDYPPRKISKSNSRDHHPQGQTLESCFVATAVDKSNTPMFNPEQYSQLLALIPSGNATPLANTVLSTHLPLLHGLLTLVQQILPSPSTPSIVHATTATETSLPSSATPIHCPDPTYTLPYKLLLALPVLNLPSSPTITSTIADLPSSLPSNLANLASPFSLRTTAICIVCRPSTHPNCSHVLSSSASPLAATPNSRLSRHNSHHNYLVLSLFT
ncbi:hypothetical protein BUALT_Bualt11G0051800 [Buddleja alternifolia]|uniref:Retrotransposon Copia-like N-terminal domain-containing protein n=1 Tax=Buddleja alternifolia TaxID=168488 RepID=A0AAV6X0Q4_9LAMI|nr:hypothetical protein BUALT_Bualt11G0051800 [Buddleja alternifolia]